MPQRGLETMADLSARLTIKNDRKLTLLAELDQQLSSQWSVVHGVSCQL